MSRPSIQALAVPTINVRHNRLAPPLDLEPEVARVFREIVNGVDATHFSPSDSTLLVEYSRAVVQADQAAREMAANGAVVDGKVSPWLAVQEKSQRAMGMLSIRLRLGPQSRYDRVAAGRNARTSGSLGIEALLNDR